MEGCDIMARIETALLMTVGTGIGESMEAPESLAHAMLYSIDSYNPDKVVFFGSELSKITISSLKDQFKDNFHNEFDYYEFIQLDEIDNFKAYFNAFKSKILELSDYKIIIDYTSGTKTMTMAAAFASMMFNKKLFFVSGEREYGIVKKGTEKIISQNLYPIYDDLMISKIKEFFNLNRFEAGKLLVNDLVEDNGDKDIFIKLFDSYYAFDNGDYKTALFNFDNKSFSEKWPSLKEEFEGNIMALNILNNKKHNLKHYYILGGLLNNARRRGEESKYDDAVARLYRSLEFIAQIKLEKDYFISTSDIDVDTLRKHQIDEEYIEELEIHRGEDNKIKIGLIQDYLLLNELGDDLGKFYLDNEKKIKNVTKFRNESILAHGLNSLNKEQYEKFYDIVLKVSEVFNNNISKYIKETMFPEFDI